MESFKWSDVFVTGLLEVDDQHQRLVDLINQYGTLIAQDHAERDDSTRVLVELADYASFHFEEEQAMFLSVGVDQRHVDLHLQEHHKFLYEVRAMSASLQARKHEGSSRLLSFLTHWLAHHILGTDQNMARQVRAIEAGGEPAAVYEQEEQRDDESTGPLLAALDGLFKLVSQRNRELRELNASLEAKVEERTRELERANRHLSELSLTDALTRLPNRRHALRRLEVLWAETARAQVALSCIMVDADHFKEVNDLHGHDAGDVVLVQLARTLEHSFRNDDIVCRLGGDEFLVLCPHTDEAGAVHIAEQVRSIVKELRVAVGDSAWHGSVSMGVAARRADDASYESLISRADQAVYSAKRAGKNCVRVG